MYLERGKLQLRLLGAFAEDTEQYLSFSEALNPLATR